MSVLPLVTPELSGQVGFLMPSAFSKPEYFPQLLPHRVQTLVFLQKFHFDVLAALGS